MKFLSLCSGIEAASTAWEPLGWEACAIASFNAVRRLTPTETERLQGFPDGHTLIPWRKKLQNDCPDGPRYKAIGNSMAVPVMAWIGERIQIVDEIPTKKISHEQKKNRRAVRQNERVDRRIPESQGCRHSNRVRPMWNHRRGMGEQWGGFSAASSSGEV